jgi:hypothetical protein
MQAGQASQISQLTAAKTSGAELDEPQSAWLLALGPWLSLTKMSCLIFT